MGCYYSRRASARDYMVDPKAEKFVKLPFLMSVSLVRELRENSKHKIRTAALPGLFCLKNGLISDLHLQDFNPEVIEHITKPNVALNQCSNSKIPRAETRFFSGMYV